MTKQNAKPLIVDLSVKSGLIIGLISVALSAILYFINPVIIYTQYWIPLLLLIITIILLVFFGMNVRAKIGGFWNFGAAFKSLIIMCAVMTVLSVVYNFVLYSFVDPNLPEKANIALLNKVNASLQESKASEDQIDTYTKSFKNGDFIAGLKPTFFNELKALVFGMMFYAVICLIIAACIKKKEPLYINTSDEQQQ